MNTANPTPHFDESLKIRRQQAIVAMINRVRGRLRDGVDVDSIEFAKGELMKLCEQSELFPRDDFPVPTRKQKELFFHVHEDQDREYALYVNSALPGQYYGPHNHGTSWAIIAAIEGDEVHGLYRQTGHSTAEWANDITVRPGTAVSMLPGGIHSIRASGNTPLLHLHFYGQSFEIQGERTEFDLERGTAKYFTMNDSDLSYIIDMK
ncbi:MAG: hypothetical protein F4Z15_09115 [Gammaproteobacteria bacterium]|nr:hypothetical protein [Gammaproteobacteria bacterium]